MDYQEQQVWDRLQNIEQVVLSLLHAQDLSLSSAAKLLSKRTYQIRRINYQAIKMYRIFFEYFDGDPLKEDIFKDAPELARRFLEEAIMGLKPSSHIRLELALELGLEVSDITSTTNKYLTELKKEGSEILTLLREIDRYRRRFLPVSYQWPSPYRRKRNRSFKRLADKIWGYQSYLLLAKHPRQKVRVFIPMCSDEGFTAKEIPLSEQLKVLLTDTLEFPYFKNISDALFLAEVIYNYHKVKRKNQTIGANYIYQLRVTLEKAENYKTLFRIPEDISIDKAFIENDRQLKQFMEKKAEKSHGARRANTALFNNPDLDL